MNASASLGWLMREQAKYRVANYHMMNIAVALISAERYCYFPPIFHIGKKKRKLRRFFPKFAMLQCRTQIEGSPIEFNWHKRFVRYVFVVFWNFLVDPKMTPKKSKKSNFLIFFKLFMHFCTVFIFWGFRKSKIFQDERTSYPRRISFWREIREVSIFSLFLLSLYNFRRFLWFNESRDFLVEGTSIPKEPFWREIREVLLKKCLKWP